MSVNRLSDDERRALQATLDTISTPIRNSGLMLSEQLSVKYPEVSAETLACIIVDAASIASVYPDQREHLRVLFAAAFDLAGE